MLVKSPKDGDLKFVVFNDGNDDDDDDDALQRHLQYLYTGTYTSLEHGLSVGYSVLGA